MQYTLSDVTFIDCTHPHYVDELIRFQREHKRSRVHKKDKNDIICIDNQTQKYLGYLIANPIEDIIYIKYMKAFIKRRHIGTLLVQHVLTLYPDKVIAGDPLETAHPFWKMWDELCPGRFKIEEFCICGTPQEDSELILSEIEIDPIIIDSLDDEYSDREEQCVPRMIEKCIPRHIGSEINISDSDLCSSEECIPRHMGSEINTSDSDYNSSDWD